jgi:hypothetical protein
MNDVEGREPGQEGDGNSANRAIVVNAPKPELPSWIPFGEVAEKLGVTKPCLRYKIKTMDCESQLKKKGKFLFVDSFLAKKLYDEPAKIRSTPQSRVKATKTNVSTTFDVGPSSLEMLVKDMNNMLRQILDILIENQKG